MDQSGPRISPSVVVSGVTGSRPLAAPRIVAGRARRARRAAGDSEKVKVAVLTCQCTTSHKNSKGAFGCGASWLVGAKFDLSDGGKRRARLSTVGRTDATAIWPAAQAYATTVSSQLTTVQSSAKTWQTALTAILGLVTVVSLVGGRSTLQTLSTTMQAVIVALAAVAVAANARGIYKSTLASIGFPAIRGVADTFDLSNSDLWPLRQTVHALANLRAAMFWSAVAFGAGVLAVGFVWLAPPAAAPAAKVDLTVLQPTPSPDPTATVPVAVCGVLPSPQPTGSPASIAIVPSSTASPAPTVTYPMTSVAGIAPGSC